MNEPRTYRVLNLGAGVQSTTIALMIHRGELPPIDVAIFADTQEEPAAVYRHLEWLIKEVEPSFPVWIRTAGKLGEDVKTGCAVRGRLFPERRNGGRFASIPAYTASKENNREGMSRRQCTSEYKIDVIELAIRREYLGLQPRQRIRKGTAVTQIIGLSFDEPGRVVRVRERFAETPGFLPEFPLFALAMTRRDCRKWLDGYPLPHPIQKSSCVFCPYHDNATWRHIRDTDPAGWQRAVEIDNALRVPGNIFHRNIDNSLFVHRSCVPLEQADLSDKPLDHPDQRIFAFTADCTGMCGV